MPKNLVWTSDKVRQYWNAVGSSELDKLAFSRVAGKQFLERVKPYLPETAKTVVDFGAGAGHFSEYLADAGYEVRIFEPSKDIVMPKLLERSNVSWVDPDNPGEPADILFCLEAIEHIIEEELDSFFTRMKALVKPGGTIVISTPHNEILETAKVYCVESDTFFHPWQHVRSFTRQSLIDFIAPHGIVCDVTGTEDFSGTRSLYEELYAYRGQAQDFSNILFSLRDDDQPLNDESKKALEKYWENGKENFLLRLQEMVSPVSNNMSELIRRIQVDVRLDDGAANHIVDAAENVGRHVREFERVAKVARDGEDMSADQIIAAAQQTTASAMDAILRINIAKAVQSEKPISETLAALNESVESLIAALERFKAPLFPLTQANSGSTNTQSLPQEPIGEMSETALREAALRIYSELSMRKTASPVKSHTGFNFEFGAGSTLILIGHKES